MGDDAPYSDSASRWGALCLKTSEVVSRGSPGARWAKVNDETTSGSLIVVDDGHTRIPRFLEVSVKVNWWPDKAASSIAGGSGLATGGTVVDDLRSLRIRRTPAGTGNLGVLFAF